MFVPISKNRRPQKVYSNTGSETKAILWVWQFVALQASAEFDCARPVRRMVSASVLLHTVPLPVEQCAVTFQPVTSDLKSVEAPFDMAKRWFFHKIWNVLLMPTFVFRIPER